MASTQSLSTVRYIPLAWKNTRLVCRLEVEVLGRGNPPSEQQTYELDYWRNGKKWTMKVTHSTEDDYDVAIRVPKTVAKNRSAFRKYQRIDDGRNEYLERDAFAKLGARQAASFFIGAECYVDGEALTYATPWNFLSGDRMQGWDVILCFGKTRFYVHKAVLSIVSSTFNTMFNGDFREKNQEVVPVNVDGTHAEHFEAFLHCVYPYGAKPRAEFIVELITLADYFGAPQLLDNCVRILRGLPHVSKVDKLRVALKLNSTALQEEFVASLTTDDARDLLASADLKDQLDNALWQKVVEKILD